MEETLNLRRMNRNDKQLLFDWVNDKDCRNNSFEESFITLEEHERWFQEKLNDARCKAYILESEMKPIGQIRIDLDEKGWKMSTSIAKEFRGLGYGKIIFQMLENYLMSVGDRGIILYACVKKDNIVSQKILENLNYVKEESDTYYQYLKRVEEEHIISRKNRGGVLILSNNRNSFVLYDWLQEETSVSLFDEKVELNMLKRLHPKIIVSYNYKYIIEKPIIDYMNGNIINLHISYLPWNRGSNPNFWSFIKDTPKGVTIHYINEGLDTGKVIAQRQIYFIEETESFASSYDRLNYEIIELLKEHWKDIESGSIDVKDQDSGGSYQSKSDFIKYMNGENLDWNENISHFKKRKKELNGNQK